MADACTMKLEPMAHARSGPFEVILLAPPTLCLTPDVSTDVSEFAGTVQIVNRGTQPESVTWYVGASAGHSFRAKQLVETGKLRGKMVFTSRPLAPEDVKTETLELAPGHAVQIESETQHLDLIRMMVGNGETLDQAPVPPAAQSRRSFEVSYSVGFRYGADKIFSETFRVPLVVQVAPE